jgi:hypothetical protein
MRPAVDQDDASGAAIVTQAIALSSLPLADFARLVLRVSPQTVRDWAAGRVPVPDDVRRLLSWFVSMATTRQQAFLRSASTTTSVRRGHRRAR